MQDCFFEHVIKVEIFFFFPSKGIYIFFARILRNIILLLIISWGNFFFWFCGGGGVLPIMAYTPGKAPPERGIFFRHQVLCMKG